MRRLVVYISVAFAMLVIIGFTLAVVTFPDAAPLIVGIPMAMAILVVASELLLSEP